MLFRENIVQERCLSSTCICIDARHCATRSGKKPLPRNPVIIVTGIFTFPIGTRSGQSSSSEPLLSTSAIPNRVYEKRKAASEEPVNCTYFLPLLSNLKREMEKGR